MAQLANTFEQDEVALAFDEAHYLARKYEKEMRVYYYAYIKGGFYKVTTSNYSAGDNETLVAIFNNY